MGRNRGVSIDFMMTAVGH